jgi:NAD(P)-dependent dehydrogenase (short-subunit alcohol dehydrogenase family)
VIRQVDVALADEVDKWIEDAVKEFGKLDGAANVAGLSKRKPDTNSANIVRARISTPNPRFADWRNRWKNIGTEL